MDLTHPAVRLETPPVLRERVTHLALASALRPVADADLTLVVVPGAHLPDCLDGLMYDSRPHLVVRVLEDRAVVGPFVAPGVTACARCVVVSDAAEDLDPTRALRHAFAGESAAVLAPVPGRVWPLLTVAVGMAAQDVVAWREGRRPSTWSATWTLLPEALPQGRAWHAHPWCGCSWFEAPE